MTDDITNAVRQPWHWSRRLGFRFVLILALLVVLPFPLGSGVYGIGGPVGPWWEALWSPIVPWIAEHVLRIGTGFPRYSGGETTWDYIQTGTSVAIAIVAAMIWSLIDRRHSDHRQLDLWLRVYLRLILASVLFSYGWSKVLPVQFPALGPERLSETFGEASPNGFMWAFMGYSQLYMAFAGAGEMVAGLLLCFRRTVTLGALIGIAVMSNVVAMNFAFDVGVKIHSTFWLLGLVYLAAPDAMRLANVLVLNRPAGARVLSLPAVRPSMQRWVVALPALLAAFFFVREGVEAWDAAHTRGQFAAHPPLYGLYDVEAVIRNGATRSLVPDDTALWSRVAIGQRNSTIRLTSGTLGFYTASVDTSTRNVRFTSRDDPSQVFKLAYERTDTGMLVLRGRIGPDSTELRLRRRDERKYRLMSHEFHWFHNTNENR